MLSAKIRDKKRAFQRYKEYTGSHPESKINASWVTENCFETVGQEQAERDITRKIIKAGCKFQFKGCKITQDKIGKILKDT
jgi:hypothetical protein